jgi:hypothetical protein
VRQVPDARRLYPLALTFLLPQPPSVGDATHAAARSDVVVLDRSFAGPVRVFDQATELSSARHRAPDPSA